MVNTFAVIAGARDSQSVTHSAPPSTFQILLWLAAFLLLIWLSITGRLAESVHWSWKDTWTLPGIMDDLPTLKQICRWFGLAMLLLISVMCIVGFLHYFRDSPTSSSNRAVFLSFFFCPFLIFPLRWYSAGRSFSLVPVLTGITSSYSSIAFDASP